MYGSMVCMNLFLNLIARCYLHRFKFVCDQSN
jgi:hypothetical protein